MIWLLSRTWAADIEVGGAGYPDLDYALQYAAYGDRLLLHGGAWYGSYVPPTSVTIEAWPGEAVTLYPDNSAGYGSPEEDGFFRVQNGKLTLRGVTLDGGNTYRLARLVNGHALDIEDCVITDGYRDGTGGALMVESGVLTLRDTILQGNHAEHGGAVAVNSGGFVYTERARFEDNVADELGGAIWADGSSVIGDSVLIGNAAQEGGAIYQNGSLVVSGSRLCGNVAGEEGGAIAAHSNATLSYNVLFGNQASTGGAVALVAATGTWWNNDFVANQGNLQGSALYVEGATVALWNSILTDHPVAGDLFATAGGTVQLTTSIAWNNVASVGTYPAILADPLFVSLDLTDCEASDLHLRSGSPAIGAGSAAFDDDIGAFPCADIELAGDGIDGDCDGSELCYQDLDLDGYGTEVPIPSVSVDCSTPGLSLYDTDCDDTNASVHPGQPELPVDGVDSDCDGQDLCYADADGDSYGTGDPELLGPTGCEGQGVAPLGGDCDDANTAVSPGRLEVGCNTVDDDCDPNTLDEGDGDGDGHDICVDDCDDSDPYVYAGAQEVCNDIDDDCDLLVDDEDDSLDTTGLSPVYPDEDGDGHGAGPGLILCSPPPGLVELGDDCDDRLPLAHPGAPEQCGNTVDDDCDGAIDEAAPPVDWFVDADTDGYGDPATAVSSCLAPAPDSVYTGGDCDDEEPLVHPDADDICDGLDNDCDALFDEGPFGPTWYTDADEDGYGDPLDGAPSCAAPAGTAALGTDCDDADPLRFPAAPERCNALDDDCDQEIDEDLPQSTSFLDEDADGWGIDPALQGCVPEGAALQAGDCDDGQPLTFPGAGELCDGLDNDCDGAVDQGCALESDTGVGPKAVGCSCDSSGMPSGSWLLGLLLVGSVSRTLRPRRVNASRALERRRTS